MRPREGGLRRGENFWLRVTTASAQCLRLSERFFIICCDFTMLVGQQQGSRTHEKSSDVSLYTVIIVIQEMVQMLNSALRQQCSVMLECRMTLHRVHTSSKTADIAKFRVRSSLRNP